MSLVDNVRGRFKEKGVFAFVIEAIGTISVGSLVCSTILNQIVFADWGLSFARIASPSDIALSGFELILHSILPAAFVAMGTVFYEFGVTRIRMTAIRKVFAFLLVVSVALEAYLLSHPPSHDESEHFFESTEFWLTPLLTFCGGVAISLVFGLMQLRSTKHRAWMYALFLLVLTFLVGEVSVCSLMRKGYQATPQTFADDSASAVKPSCKSKMRPLVLWASPTAIVYRCSRADTRVLYVQDSVTLVPLRGWKDF